MTQWFRARLTQLQSPNHNTTMPDNTDPAIIRLDNVRLSFPHLFQAHAMEEGQEKKFGATFIFPNEQKGKLYTGEMGKKEPEGNICEKIEKLIERLALDQFKKKVHFKSCLRDGNEKPDMDGYGDGVMFLTASSKTRRQVVDRDVQIPITEEDGKIYAGCYVNASVRLWVQDNKWGKRVNAELRAVQFVKDGDSFGAAPVNAENEFESLMDDDMF